MNGIDYSIDLHIAFDLGVESDVYCIWILQWPSDLQSAVFHWDESLNEVWALMKSVWLDKVVSYSLTHWADSGVNG